jgi:mono/diheme cytochrome c family protein
MKLLTLLALVPLLFLSGCGVREPGKLETKTALLMKHRITVGGGKQRNPLPPDEENIHHGQKSFGSYCVSCHGLDGHATGVPFADRMSPPVPDLGSADVQSYSDGQLKWIIENGIYPSGMPASKGIFADEEIWQMVHYIRHLPPKGSLGEPTIYSGASGK